MDIDVHTQNENIRKIEDIIDIQKANGNFNVRQVAFNLPSDSENPNIARSLESGLSKSKESKKKFKKLRTNRHKCPADVISWPSDSDITVLRMKLCLAGNELKERVDNVIPGDGLHQRDSSSMVNLATLMRQSQPPSKHSFTIEEYLLPLTSWERQESETEKAAKVKEALGVATDLPRDYNTYEAVCSHERDSYSSKDSEYSRIGAVSKLARFLRLYFCPCCTCLYRLEKMRDEPAVYFTQNKRCFKITNEA